MTLTIPAPANFDRPPDGAVRPLPLARNTPGGGRRPGGSAPYATHGMEGEA